MLCPNHGSPFLTLGSTTLVRSGETSAWRLWDTTSRNLAAPPTWGGFSIFRGRMDALDLDISALCEDSEAPSRRYWLPVMVTGLGREYAKRWFADKRKPEDAWPFALVVAESEEEARKWAHGCTDVEAVTAEQIEYRVQACFPRCLGALLVRREHGEPRWYWLTQTTSDLT